MSEKLHAPDLPSNCLEGFQCPKCKQSMRFWIDCSALMEVTDDGIQDYGDVDWTPDSACACPHCEHSATVKDFHPQAQECVDEISALERAGNPPAPAGWTRAETAAE